MKRNQVVTSIFALMLFACLFGVEGQYYTSPQTSGDQYAMSPLTATSPTVQYSQYYTMGQAPNAHITAPQQVDLTGNLPATVYFGFEQQPVPFSQYQSDPAFAAGNSLWIQGPSSWTQYASVPQGASLALLALSSTGGNGYLYEIYPNDQVVTNAYYFYPRYSQFRFYADAVGQHILLFTTGNQASNAIVINVVPYYGPTYLQPLAYQQPPTSQPNYGQSGYPSYGDY